MEGLWDTSCFGSKAWRWGFCSWRRFWPAWHLATSAGTSGDRRRSRLGDYRSVRGPDGQLRRREVSTPHRLRVVLPNGRFGSIDDRRFNMDAVGWAGRDPGDAATLAGAARSPPLAVALDCDSDGARGSAVAVDISDSLSWRAMTALALRVRVLESGIPTLISGGGWARPGRHPPLPPGPIPAPSVQKPQTAGI